MVGQMFHGGIVACDECTKNCLTKHHLERRGSLSTARRFFKIMHGKNYSEVLYLPPKIARDVRHLVGQETRIEDSNGKKWTVQFSYVDGALAFHEGWYKFVEDHQLEHGEILVFNYIKHGHFVVQIYGLSACEVMDFNRGRKLSKKRSRSDQETVFQDEPHQIRNEKFTLTSENMEDPSCVLNRDSGKYEVEDREFLFDLSNFEIGKNSSVAEKSDTLFDRNITPVETQISKQVEIMRNGTEMSMPLTNQKNERSFGSSADALQTKPSSSSNSTKDMPDDVSKFSAGEMENNCLHGITSDALQNKPSVNSVSSKGIPNDISKFQVGETENDRLCDIFSDSLQKKPCGNSDSRKGMTDAIKFRSAATNNYQPCGISSDVFPAKPSSNSDASKDTFDDISKFPSCDSAKDMFDDVSKFLSGTSVFTPSVARDMKSPYICSSLLAESDYSINSKHCDTSVSSSMLKDPFGKSAATLKKEVVKLGEEVYGFTRASSEDAGLISTLGMKCSRISSSCVKNEPDMDDVLVSAVDSSPFSAQVKSLKFLELPLVMPSVQGKREHGRGKIVYLKHSTTRLWPVLYPGTSLVRAFTDGWTTFCKGNSIRAGDVCRFQFETYIPCVFKVDIIRKAGESSEL